MSNKSVKWGEAILEWFYQESRDTWCESFLNGFIRNPGSGGVLIPVFTRMTKPFQIPRFLDPKLQFGIELERETQFPKALAFPNRVWE